LPFTETDLADEAHVCSVYNVHYTFKPTSTYSGTLDTLKPQLNQVLRLYLGGAVGSVVYKIKDEFRILPVVFFVILLLLYMVFHS
jgi:hypothetical protein